VHLVWIESRIFGEYFDYYSPVVSVFFIASGSLWFCDLPEVTPVWKAFDVLSDVAFECAVCDLYASFHSQALKM